MLMKIIIVYVTMINKIECRAKCETQKWTQHKSEIVVWHIHRWRYMMAELILRAFTRSAKLKRKKEESAVKEIAMYNFDNNDNNILVSIVAAMELCLCPLSMRCCCRCHHVFIYLFTYFFVCFVCCYCPQLLLLQLMCLCCHTCHA